MMLPLDIEMKKEMNNNFNFCFLMRDSELGALRNDDEVFVKDLFLQIISNYDKFIFRLSIKDKTKQICRLL